MRARPIFLGLLSYHVAVNRQAIGGLETVGLRNTLFAASQVGSHETPPILHRDLGSYLV